MKAGWEVKSLREIATLRPNKKEVRQELDDTDNVSFVPMDCLNTGTQQLSPHEKRPLSAVYGSYTYFRDGDVLLAKITPCFENGKLGIARELANDIGFGSSEFFVVRPKPGLLAEYIYYFLDRQSFRDDAQRRMTGAVGHKRVPKELLENLEIPLPPFEEQQRIVAVLDEAFEGLDRARENAEANLENARELFESLKSDALNYKRPDSKQVTLADVTAITSGLVDPREAQYADMPHLGAGNMITGSDELIDVKTAREEKLKSGKYLFDARTVLYSKIRPYLKKAARPDFEGICSADVYPITPKAGVLDRDFLFHTLLSTDFTEYAISRLLKKPMTGAALA